MQSVDTLLQEPDRGPGRAGWGGTRGGAVLVFGPTGGLIARHDPAGVFTDEVADDLGRELFSRDDDRPHIVSHSAVPGGAYARPVASARHGRRRGWIVVATPAGGIDESVRLIAQEAAAVVGLELMQRAAVSETERRLTTALVADAIAGRTEGDEIGRRLAAFGIEGEVAVFIFATAEAEAERRLQEALAVRGHPGAVSLQEVEGHELLCAIVGLGERDANEVAVEAGRLAEEIGEPASGLGRAGARASGPSVGVGRTRPAADLPRTFQEAYWALGAGDGPVGTWQDLGVESLLLAVADPDVLRLYCDRLLGPVLAGDSIYAAELLHSLELFILHNGQWERAARELHCHRHTLRYRMRKIEELTGRDLGKATDRIEFWLALRARALSWSHRAS